MSDKRFRRRILEKIRSRYRLIIVNDTSYQTVFTLRLTPLKVFTILSLFSAFMIFLVIFLVASTPLKEYMPGYPKQEYREMLLKNVLVVDSLERELAVRDKYFNDFKTVIAGNIPRESSEGIQVSEKKEKGEFKRYNPDSIFEEKLLEERLNLSNAGGGSGGSSPERIHFYVPVKGMVSNKFNAAKNHYGVDIVAKQNSRITSVLPGTVIFAGFTTETGNVIYIQHENNLTSAYKHNAELLKKAGDRVSAGEAIAIIGNTGAQTTGPHLHFELWYSGKPIDPEKYIEF